MIRECSPTFNTQYCYIDGKPIHIKEYFREYNQNNHKRKICCQNGHELEFHKGEKKKMYFKHKNHGDARGGPMSQWHSDMQGYFPIIERYFKKDNNESQLKNRWADVFIEKCNIIIEIQHSKIDAENVKCRHDDYKYHKAELIWMVDGNTEDVEIKELTKGGFLVIFSESWKYRSFKYNNEYILLNEGDRFFRIPVRSVHSGMISVNEWKHIDDVMSQLNKDPLGVWSLWGYNDEIKPKMTVYQKGAGNGKTYGIWKSILTNVDKKRFLILTKQHSAVAVIKNELDEQAKRNEMHIENMEDTSYDVYCKKHKVRYTHMNSNYNCIVIIATIDSFVYNIVGVGRESSTNIFGSLLEKILTDGCTKVNSNTGGMRYAGEHFLLNKMTEIWIDEAQDLNENYFNSMVKLMCETKIDTVMVGDKLQSLEYKNNIITKSDGNIEEIDIVLMEPENTNRRIEVKNMKEKLNELINFENFDLPPISVDSNRNLLDHGENVIETIDQPSIYNDHSKENFEKMEKFIDNIINKVDSEVKSHNYEPKDFMFIFPMMKGNIIAGELETRLNEYWINKLPESNEYQKYAYLHRHEEGKVIDMSQSNYSSRIVTIRTSKGDGRKVVFVLSCTEEALTIISQNHSRTNGLIYESYFHVAMTRVKNKLFFGLVKNNDDIHQRFGKTGLVEYEPKIKNSINLDQVLKFIEEDSIIKILKNNGVEEEPSCEESKMSEHMVDWNYHCIRRAIYLMYAIFSILKKNRDGSSFDVSQLKVVLDNLKSIPILKLEPKKFYNILRRSDIVDEKTGKSRGLDYFPLCNLSHKPMYKNFCQRIEDIMKENQKKYKEDNLSLCDLKPLEMVIQWYMIELYSEKQFHQTTPTTIYNILDYFNGLNGEKEKELLEEARNINGVITKSMNEILSSNSKINWNIFHKIFYNGVNEPKYNKDDIKIIINKDIIGFNETTVYHMVFKSDLNSLNYWSTMIEIILERFIIYNTSNKGDDVNKFKGKNIKTYIFSLKEEKCYDFTIDDANDKTLREELKKALVKHYSSFNIQLYRYCQFVKESSKWKEQGVTTPLEYISKKYNKIKYVRDFFTYLHNRRKEDKVHVNRLINDETLFCNKLNEYIEEMCDNMLNLNDIEEDDW